MESDEEGHGADDEHYDEGHVEEQPNEARYEVDAGFQYVPSTNWMFQNEEYEPDPNYELEAKVLTPLEFCNGAYVLRKYCTNQQARVDAVEYSKKLEAEAKLKPVEVPEPLEWVADNLYGSVLVSRRGPVGPNPLDVDPTLAHRDKRIVLTPEEEELYGPMEPASPPPLPNPPPPQIAGVHLPSAAGPVATGPDDVPEAFRFGLDFPGLPNRNWDGHPMMDPAMMYFYEEDFKLIPGDVIIYTFPRREEPPSWEIPHPHDPPALQELVGIYEDPDYFYDHGQFRLNFLDNYPLEKGDLVVRFGNFNGLWLWNKHPTINFYMYWPGLKPPAGSDKKILHPWYWINQGLPQYGGPNGPVLPISLPLAPTNMPVGSRVPGFRLRNGDVLIHHHKIVNIAPPFDHKLECYVWNPMMADIGHEKFLSGQDRVLRHGMEFQSHALPPWLPWPKISTSSVHVELYSYDAEGTFRFLGRWTSDFCDHIMLKPTLQPLGGVPLAGDIVVERDRMGSQIPGWNDKLNVGGMVTFYRLEDYMDSGKEVREFVWYRDAGKYGVGNVTMVVRLGQFDAGNDDPSQDWTWRHGNYAKLFILNTRGSSWRLNSAELWPFNLPYNQPNYSWKPYNPEDLQEVAHDFGPQPGDLIVRLSMDKLSRRTKKENPVYVGPSFNPHYRVKVRMGIWGPHLQLLGGDFIIRAGYEKNTINPGWTNTTVECYRLEDVFDGLAWRCKGRDMFIYGTNYMAGGLKGVEQSGVGDFSVDEVLNINSSPHRKLFGAPKQ